MPLDLNPHKTAKSPDGGVRITRVNPYIRLSERDKGSIFIQNGQFFYENGPAVKDDEVPGWVWEQVDKMTPEGRRKVGLDESQPTKKK